MIGVVVSRFRSSTTAVVTAVGFLTVFLATTILALVSYEIVARHVADGAARRQDGNIRAAATVLEHDLPGTRVEWNAAGNPRIVMPAVPAFADHHAIDAISRVTGDTTTVFALDPASGEFVRRSTSVKKADGSRAVGTVLGRGGPVHPVLARGETYSGIVDILGVPYSTTYVPIFAPDGAVIGAVYSGVKTSAIDGLIREWTFSILLAGGGVLVLAAAAQFLLGRRLTRPLVDLATTLRRISGGELDAVVPHRDRVDEVGEVARTVDALRLAAAERERLAAEQTGEHTARAAEQARVARRIAAFRHSVADLRGALARDVETMGGTAGELAGLADEATRRAENATRATESASGGVRAVADAAGGLAASVAEIDRRAAAAAEVVGEARRSADESSTRIARLAEASARI
ncbi:MAG: methyl-accepting chemotaxis protein, partial [Phyllobacteriaceae bacterium]|nr:methyl-accepting chemotaxis protein [Phyllobacteriaceae bacterium]